MKPGRAAVCRFCSKALRPDDLVIGVVGTQGDWEDVVHLACLVKKCGRLAAAEYKKEVKK